MSAQQAILRDILAGSVEGSWSSIQDDPTDPLRLMVRFTATGAHPWPFWEMVGAGT